MVNFRTSTRITAQLVGGTGINVDRENGIYTVDIDFAELVDFPSINAEDYDATSFPLVQEIAGQTFYGKMTFTNLVAQVSGQFQPVDSSLTALSTSANNSGVPLYSAGVPTFTSTTGTGNFVRVTSPTLVTPALGTPSSVTLTNATGLPVATGISGLGTGVATFLATPSSANLAAALTDETGSGAAVFATSPTLTTPNLGTPSAVTLTNATGLPVATGISGLASGIATFLSTPSSANLRAALTDEVGTGAAYFVGGALGTPASATLTNATGLPLSGLATQAAYTFVGNNSGSSAVPTAVDIAALTTKASPGAADYVMLSDQAASGAWKKATVSSLATSSGVSSLNSQTGAIIHNVPRGVIGLNGSRNSGTATRLDLAADQITFIDPSTNLAVVKTAVASTACDIATAGSAAGGRDQAGAFSSGSTVHFYWIATAAGATVSLVASLAAPTTGPTLPATYTMWAYATTLVMTGSNLFLCYVRGSKVYYQARQAALTNGTSTLVAAIDLSTLVPSTSGSVDLNYHYDNATANIGDYTADLELVNGTVFFRVAINVYTNGGNAIMDGAITIPNVGQNVYYVVNSSSTRFTLYVLGYSIRNGDGA